MSKPSIGSLLADASIVFALNLAWRDSLPGGSDAHEEGGFVTLESSGRLLVIRWPKGLHNEIVLPPHPNCTVAGGAIVATFHTHPNTGKTFQQEPSLTDIRAVSEDFDLKGDFYLGELVISEENIYLIEPTGDYSVVGLTRALLGR